MCLSQPCHVGPPSSPHQHKQRAPGSRTSTAALRSALETLVFRYQHTCTVVLARRWPCPSREPREPRASSDSCSRETSEDPVEESPSAQGRWEQGASGAGVPLAAGGWGLGNQGALGPRSAAGTDQNHTMLLPEKLTVPPAPPHPRGAENVPCGRGARSLAGGL